MKKLFLNRNYAKLFFGNVTSRFGSAIMFMAITWFVLESSTNPLILSGLFIINILPSILLSAPIGHFVDKINKKSALIITDICNFMLYVALFFIMINGLQNIYLILFVVFLNGILSNIFGTAIETMIPQIIEGSELQSANSMDYILSNATTIMGYGLAGLLISIMKFEGVILLNAITFLVSAFVECFIDYQEADFISDQNDISLSIRNEFRNTLTFMSKSKILHIVLYSSFLNFISSGLLIVGIPYYFRNKIGLNANGFGIASMIFPLGAIVGALIIGNISEIKNKYNFLFRTVFTQNLLVLIIGIFSINYDSNYLLLLFSLYLVYVVINNITGIPIRVLLQSKTPYNRRGKVIGIVRTLGNITMPLSILLFGVLLNFFDISILMIGISVVQLLSVLALRKEWFGEMKTQNIQEELCGQDS